MARPGAELSALLGQGASYTGDMAFEGRVRVDGRFVGRIYTDDVLEIGEPGHVEGEIDAEVVRIAGSVDGKILARRRLTILPTGRVTGEVEARELEVHPGARIDGRLVCGLSL